MVYGVSQNLTVQPRPVTRTIRPDTKRAITSGDAGFVLPVAHFPMLREDGIRNGRLRVNFVMGETADRLLNGVMVNVEAHFVPRLAFERFNGMESFNRSWAKQPEIDDSVIPFYNTMTVDQAAYPAILSTLGIHAQTGDVINTDVIESYNALINWQRAQRSKSLTLRDPLDGTLARGFWQNTQLREVVPSFDTQQLHGDVNAHLTSGGSLPVLGLGLGGAATPQQGTFTQTDGSTYSGMQAGVGTANNAAAIATTADGLIPQVFAELAEEGITFSLSDIEMARKTQAFATMRNRYQSIPEEYLIDMLMDGLRIPDLMLAEPLLLSRRSTLFGWSQRYATDYANLDKSMTEGETFVDLSMRMPPHPCGGMVLVTATITPEQLYERQMDHCVHITDQDNLPKAMVDALDPEKVTIMNNDEVDVSHTIDGVFGYRPLNSEWYRDQPSIGGKFFRPDPTAAWDEDRNRFWATETVDPELTEDFYLCTTLPKDIFVDANVDSYEVSATGQLNIVGLTQFGSALREATDDYEKIMAQVDTDRIVQPAAQEAGDVIEEETGENPVEETPESEDQE